MYSQVKREKQAEIQQKIENEKREKYALRGKKDVKHYGKIDMARSAKPKIKKQEKKEEKPQKVIDYNAYLGQEITDVLLGDYKEE